ncbi:MAG: multidrug efflux system outer membrane protein [Verrucomicrobiales bacterium]|jgi:multidrug efflux system outer membrane protein
MKKLLVLCTAGLTACATVGPDHEVPETETPEHYKNASAASKLPERGQWWMAFKDADLNALLNDLDTASPNQAAALAKLDQARAELRTAKAGGWPSIRGNTDSRRLLESENTGFRISESTYESYELALNLDYEIDLWGRVRRQVEAARARGEAAEATYEDAMLALRAELARHYFSLRSLDEEIDLLTRAVQLRVEGVELVRARAEAGQISEDDVARATAELEATRGDLTALQRDREEFENAIAALVGKSPSIYKLASKSKLGTVPGIPSGLPSELLARRADVLEKERLLAAACADVGVAIADFLPKITLTGSGGLTSLRASNLFDPASKMWDIGPEIEVPVFRKGLAKSRKAKAQATFDETRANYLQAVLNAFRDTENAINANQSLARESGQRNRATKASARASELAVTRYESGLTSYLEVLDSLRTHLANERLETQTRGDHFQAAVAMVQALGGGWKKR